MGPEVRSLPERDTPPPPRAPGREPPEPPRPRRGPGRRRVSGSWVRTFMSSSRIRSGERMPKRSVALAEGPPGLSLDPETEPAREPKSPKDPEVILGEPLAGFPTVLRSRAARSSLPPKGSWNASRIGCQATAFTVKSRRDEIFLEGIGELHHRVAPRGLHVPPEGGDLQEDPLPGQDPHGPMFDPHGNRPWKEPAEPPEAGPGWPYPNPRREGPGGCSVWHRPPPRSRTLLPPGSW